jgi:hypothetical protein
MIWVGGKCNLTFGNPPTCPVAQSEYFHQFVMVHFGKGEAMRNIGHQLRRYP